MKEYSLIQARDHREKFPGWKLVEDRSNRKIADEDALILMLEAEGFEEKQFMKPPMLQPITKLEKTVGKKHLATLAGELIVKPEGTPVLVPETDKRPELNSVTGAAADFEGL